MNNFVLGLEEWRENWNMKIAHNCWFSFFKRIIPEQSFYTDSNVVVMFPIALLPLVNHFWCWLLSFPSSLHFRNSVEALCSALFDLSALFTSETLGPNKVSYSVSVDGLHLTRFVVIPKEDGDAKTYFLSWSSVAQSFCSKYMIPGNKLKRFDKVLAFKLVLKLRPGAQTRTIKTVLYSTETSEGWGSNTFLKSAPFVGNIVSLVQWMDQKGQKSHFYPLLVRI